MDERRPIDRKREASGFDDIGTIEDGAILEMYNMDGKVIVIKEKALYEFVMADKVDPGKTNIKLPQTIQRLLVNHGANSEIVCSSFLTATKLFRDHLFETFDTIKAVKLSLDLMLELIVLDKEINDYLKMEENLSNEYNSRKNQTSSYTIPSISDVETRCKTIFQKADHSEQIIMEIIRLFYSKEKLTKHSHFSDFFEVIKVKYGEKDPFTALVERAIPFMIAIRTLRNSLDHRLPFVKVMDFEIQPDGSIYSPTVELKHKDIKIEQQSLNTFLPKVLSNFLIIFETLAAYLSSRNAKLNAIYSEVREVPEEKRRYKLVKYGYWSPLGEGGYYPQ